MRIEVVRADGKTRDRVWVFHGMEYGGKFQVVLQHYSERSRPTPRHKFQPLVVYSRLSSRDSNLSLAQVPWPADVVKEARVVAEARVQVVRELS